MTALSMAASGGEKVGADAVSVAARAAGQKVATELPKMVVR